MLELFGKTIPEKIEQAIAIVAAMERSRDIFPNPVRQLATIIEVTNEK